MSKKDRFGLLGNTIAGTFRVDRVVAEGGFGIVYQAFHLHFRAPVALKCLKIPQGLTEEDRALFLEQFRSEAEIQFRLSAELPHIVRPLHVDSVQTNDGELVPLLALEWLEGQSFEHLIEERALANKSPLSLTSVMKLIAPVAEALHRAHSFESAGERLTVVHRDVKPDNLFLTEIRGERFVKLLDFGISKLRREATHLAGRYSQGDGKAPFSPAYGAPEQWTPKRLGQTGPWTDVWGLALTLVEIIKGDLVITGDHQEMMGSTLDPKVRPSPRAEGVVVSDEVESVFLKALALDPCHRYQSIRSFWEALEVANLQSGDLTRGYDSSSSGTFIALSPASAPAPWGSSESSTQNGPALLTKLPRMVAPARLERTLVDNLKIESDPSFPSDPLSELQPVLPAATSWDNFDPEVPPSSADAHGAMPEQESSARIRQAPRIQKSLPSLANPLAGARYPGGAENAPPLTLELQPTSVFPEPASSPPRLSSERAPSPQEELELLGSKKRPLISAEAQKQSPRGSEDVAPENPLSLIPTPGRQSSGS